jgi:hypothetical protein
MIAGAVSKSDAYYTGDLNGVCGFPSIVWTGKWAFNCDFYNQDLVNEKVPGDQCSNRWF